MLSASSQGSDTDGIDNFTSWVKHSLPPLPAVPGKKEEEKFREGPTGTISASPTSLPAESFGEPRRSPRLDRGRHSHSPSTSSATRPPTESCTLQGKGTAASPNTVYAASSLVSTTGTDFYPSSGPLLRKVEDAELPFLGPRESSRSEERPHLHDFLLQSSVSSSSTAVKRDSPSDLTVTLQRTNQDHSNTLAPNSAEASNRPSASFPLQEALHGVNHSNEHSQPPSVVAQRLEPVAPSTPSTTPSERPVRRMVRRNAPPSLPGSPLRDTRVTTSVEVKEHNGVLTAAVRATAESVPTPTHNAAANKAVAAHTTPPRSPVDLLSPSVPANNYADIDAAAHAATVAAGLSADLPIRETFPIPRYCPDDLLRGEDKLWCPGKALRIAYITWNMANKAPRMDEVSANCVHPNAHVVVVGTQENGPYVGSNALQTAWAKTIGDVCLGGQYELVAKHHMWAIQMLVYVRKRDVARYVSRAHTSHVKTGMLGGWGGNKGGVAAGLVLSLTPKFVELSHVATTQRAVTTAPNTPRGERGPVVGASASGARGYPVALPAVLHTERGPTAAADDGDQPHLSPSAIAGPSPPALLNASVMQHDIDDEDAQAFQCGTQTELSAQTMAAVMHHGRENAHDDDEEDGVFSPAEMLSRNASFDLSRERQRRRKQKRKSGHSSKKKDRGGEDAQQQQQQQHSADDLSAGTPDTDTPNYMSLLFITAHLAAHQGAVVNRNKDYRQIVHGLRLGLRGPHRKFFKRLLTQRRVLGDAEDAASNDDLDEHWQDDSSEEDVMPLRLPVVSAIAHRGKMRRDVTEEFDLTFFGGDLNYRINGTRKAIEYVIQHHRNIRSILINNDQLSLERARGSVFQGYQEGNLLFRPTYKYEVSPSNGGVTLDDYNFSRKKDRMPAYCDRVLFKKKLSSAARRVAIRLYTDVPNVRTSDHRPVVALFDVGTRAYPG